MLDFSFLNESIIRKEQSLGQPQKKGLVGVQLSLTCVHHASFLSSAQKREPTKKPKLTDPLVSYVVHTEPSGLLSCWVWNLALVNLSRFIGYSVYRRNAEQQPLSLVLDPLGGLWKQCC